MRDHYHQTRNKLEVGSLDSKGSIQFCAEEGRSLPLPGTQMVSKGPTLLSLQRGTVQREGDTPQPDPGPDDFRRVTDLALVNIQFSLGPSGYQRENLLGFFPFNKKQNHPSNMGHIHNCITLFFHCIYIFIIVIFMVYL